MRYACVINALLKGILLMVPLLLVSIMLKFAFSYSCKPFSCLQDFTTSENDRAVFYFIGTSRVQQSIAPERLKADLPDNNFVNLGISNSSFLYNCKVASNLFKEGTGKKIIFIELTGLSLLPPESYQHLLHATDVPEVIRQHLSVQCTTEDFSALIFYMFNIHSDLKKIAYSAMGIYEQKQIGFMKSDRHFSGSLDALLTPQSFAIKPQINSEVADAYLGIIGQLQKEAKETGSEIQFILPLTIVNTSEFDMDMTVFSKLPDNVKWTYSAEFLNELNDPKYFSDTYHLGSRGAVRYSHELSEFIRVRFRDDL